MIIDSQTYSFICKNTTEIIEFLLKLFSLYTVNKDVFGV